jgi:hypothetical protein
MCVGCAQENAAGASDGDFASYATLALNAGPPAVGVTVRATAPAGKVFPAGSLPGVFFTLPENPSAKLAFEGFRTFLGGALQEDTNNLGLLGGDVDPAYAASPASWSWRGFSAAKDFDAVEFVLTSAQAGGSEYKIREVCGDSLLP